MNTAKRFGIPAAGTLAAILGLLNHGYAAESKIQEAFVYPHAFNSSLAEAGQTVVFESDSAENAIRIQLQQGSHRLCLDPGGEYFKGLVLNDSAPSLDSRGCTTVDGLSGVYLVHLSHSADTPTVREVALLSIDRSGVPLVTSTGEVRKGYWAVTQWISTGKTEELKGRLRAIPSPDGRMPVVADMASSQMDGYSLWQFGARSAVLLADPKSIFSVDANAFAESNRGTVFVARGGEGSSIRASGNSDRFELRVDNNDDSPGAQLGFTPTLFAPQTLKIVSGSPHSQNTPMFSLVFRFLPDTADPALIQGEAALYQSADYQGSAAVFAASIPNLASLRERATSLDHGPISMRVGPGTEAMLYTGENYSGTATSIHGNMAFLAETGTIGSMRLTPLVARLLASRSCVECDFDGVDLSGLDLAGFDLTGARLRGANLTRTGLKGARLNEADLSGATLSCTAFSGADASHRNDLTRTDFSNIRLLHSDSCRSDFSYTIMTAGLLNSQMLPEVKRTGAIIQSSVRSLRSTLVPPPNLTNGFVKNDSFKIAIPRAGYWAIQPDAALDPQHRPGRLRLELPFKDNYGLIAPIAVDYSSQQMDRLSLFQIINYQYPYGDGAILGPPAATFFDWTAAVGGVLGIGSDYVLRLNAIFPIAVMDMGGYRFSFAVPLVSSFPLYENPDGFLTTKEAQTPPLKLRVMFRYYPDGTQIGPLQPGEIALFQQPNYSGKAAVFAPGGDPVDLTAMNSPDTTIDHSAQSILVGNDTALIWTSPVAKKGVALLSMATVGDHRLNEWGAPTGRISTIPATDVLKGDQYGFDCSGCQMTGVTLSGTAQTPLSLTNKYVLNANFSDATFSHVDLSFDTLIGVDFDGATITNVSFLNAQLQATSFKRAKLSCVDFHGADSSHLADLTQSFFADAIWLTVPNCLSNLSYTKLLVAQIPPSTWSALNLTGAVFVDAAGKRLSSMGQPLTLTDAKLAGVSLQGAILDYAVLKNADLTGAFLSNTSWISANLANAKLYGAALVNANLDGANLAGVYLTKPSPDGQAANLEGAFLRNVNLSSSHLSSAKFPSASFYSTIPAGASSCAVKSNGFTDSCATAAGAEMVDTEFAGAYLYGTDFTESTVQGTHFANAFLAGANFAGAKLSSISGTGVGFSGAFLQGTNFAGATLLNGVSMASAFVDFGTGAGAFGNAIYLSLSGSHTSFPGYWGAPGDPVCVKMTYSNPTVVPATGPNDACPNGDSYSNGCGPASPDGSNPRWKSPTDITSIASYEQNATYTKAPLNGQSFCPEDLKWKPFSLSNSVKREHSTSDSK